jgi:hypothetical protein
MDWIGVAVGISTAAEDELLQVVVVAADVRCSKSCVGTVDLVDDKCWEVEESSDSGGVESATGTTPTSSSEALNAVAAESSEEVSLAARWVAEGLDVH